ncbi:MAG: hypothetical protein P4L55_04640 [Syntrophobacteraceae bacterium]|nr:hypothetical protein [Syntrophobacteraceae bacterium]
MKTKSIIIFFITTVLFVFHANAKAQSPQTTPCLNVVKGHGFYYAALAHCPGIQFPYDATQVFVACVNNATTTSEK